jgi:hypothetical protein
MENKILFLAVHYYKPKDDFIELTHPETRARILLSGKNKEVYLFLIENENCSYNEMCEKAGKEPEKFNKSDFNDIISEFERLNLVRIEETDEW